MTWDHAVNAAPPDATASRSCHVRPRQGVPGPVLSTVTMWIEHGSPLAQKRMALAALIERRNKGNRSHKLHSRICSARLEIIAMETGCLSLFSAPKS